MITRDQAEHIGRVATWLTDAPDAKLPYGDFYVNRVEVVYDGERYGYFLFHDDTWNYYTDDEEPPRFV